MIEYDLIDAVWYGQVETVRTILEKNPKIDINFVDYCGSALHIACTTLKAAEKSEIIFPMLLAFPGIDVNQLDNSQQTPFVRACDNSQESGAIALLKEPRVQISDRDERLSLYRLVNYGLIEAIKWWIALDDRKLDMSKPGVWPTDIYTGFADRRLCMNLLEEFRDKPDETRSRLKRELGLEPSS